MRLFVVIVRIVEISGLKNVAGDVHIFGCISVWVDFCIVNSDVFYRLMWFKWSETYSLNTLCFVRSVWSDDVIGVC